MIIAWAQFGIPLDPAYSAVSNPEQVQIVVALGVQRSCICITHPSLPVRLAWGPVMQTAIVQVSRGVGHLACSRDNCLGTLRCMLATLQLCAHLCEVLVSTLYSYIARLISN